MSNKKREAQSDLKSDFGATQRRRQGAHDRLNESLASPSLLEQMEGGLFFMRVRVCACVCVFFHHHVQGLLQISVKMKCMWCLCSFFGFFCFVVWWAIQ